MRSFLNDLIFMPVSNEVLASQILGLKELVIEFKMEFKDHVENDGRRLTDLEKYKFMFLGAIILMNAIFIPLLLWKITSK